MVKTFGPHRRLQVESLEDRSLPASGISSSLSHGVLSVVGTNSADTTINKKIASDKDVFQRQSGTCVILSSLSAVTADGTNLAARITKIGSNSYSVPLYRSGTGWIRQTVTFDGSWTDNDPMINN